LPNQIPKRIEIALAVVLAMAWAICFSMRVRDCSGFERCLDKGFVNGFGNGLGNGFSFGNGFDNGFGSGFGKI
jgi:hypothetical protein